MITSVCVVPIASDEESGDTGNSTAVSEGDAYGIYFTVNNESLNTVAKYLSGSLMDAARLQETIKDMMGLTTLNVLNTNILVALGIKLVDQNTNGYEFLVTSVVDGVVKVDATKPRTATNYVGETTIDPDDEDAIEDFVNSKKTSAITSKEVTAELHVDIDIDFAFDMTVVTDLDMNTISIDGVLGRDYRSTIITKTLDDHNGYDFLYTDVDKSDSSMYMEFNTDDVGDKMVLDTIWFADGDFDFIDGIPGYGDYMLPLGDKLPVNLMSILENCAIFNKGFLDDADGDVTFDELIKIISDTTIGDIIVDMVREKVKGTMIEGLITEDTKLIALYTLLYNFPLPSEDLDNIRNIVNTIKGVWDNPLVNPLGVFEVLFGVNNGLRLTNSEVRTITELADKVALKGLDGMKNREFTVNFYEDWDSDNPSVTKKVKFGKAISITDDIKSLQTKDGYRFIGWKAAIDDDWSLKTADLSKIYCNMNLYPVFAKESGSLEDLYEAFTGSDDDLYLDYTGSALIDVEKLLTSNKYVHIHVGSDDGVVKNITWSFNKPTKMSDDGANIDVNVTYGSEMVGNDIKITFNHEGALPNDTTVSVDVGAKFAPGSIVKVYHMVGEKKVLVNGLVTVDENGMAKFNIDSCSSYLIELDTNLSDITENVDKSDDDDGVSIALIVGIVVGIIVVIGIAVGVFVFIKKH